MNTKIIVCRVWNNKLQSYCDSGQIFHDPSYANFQGFTGFSYDAKYTDSGFNELDPKHIPISIPNRTYTVPEGKGVLPHYFQQFLPGEYAEQLLCSVHPQWSSLCQFDKLAKVTEIYGDYHSIMLSNYGEQVFNDIDNFDDLKKVLETLKAFSETKKADDITTNILAAISNASGKRAKVDFLDPESKGRKVLKLNNSEYFNDARVSCFVRDIEANSGIDVVNSSVLNVGDKDILMQDNFANLYQNEAGERKIIRYNQVNFKVLTSNCTENVFKRRVTYQDISECINKYSANSDEDLVELYRRAYFSASVNHTDNGLDNLSMIDVGVNEWRLSPSFHNLPSPFTNAEFSVAFDDSLIARNLFDLDEKFALRLAEDMGFDKSEALLIKAQVDYAVQNSRDLINEHQLTAGEIKILDSVIADSNLASTQELTQSKVKSRKSSFTP